MLYKEKIRRIDLYSFSQNYLNDSCTVVPFPEKYYTLIHMYTLIQI